MSSDPKSPKQASAQAAEKAEAAAIRRRWITLGEVLAVVAVLISGLTLWNSWAERSSTQAEHAAEVRQSTTKASTLILRAQASGKTLTLTPGSSEQSVQSQTIRFPTALGVDTAETTGEPRIEGGWFESALKDAREKAGLPDNSRGDERLPVAITTQYLVDGDAHEDVALYDIGYTIEGRMLGGHTIILRGLSLVTRGKVAGIEAKLDARWKTLFPKTGQ
ncbi:hypothetical protein BH10PSE12_BH10PSE12_31840 [soil metagenome]